MLDYASREAVMETRKQMLSEAQRAPLLVSKQVLALEPVCQAHKWFDYRWMSPFAATMLFARCYEDAYRRKWEQNCDADEAARKQPLRGLTNGPSALMTSLWKARQAADLSGMPYPDFVLGLFNVQLSFGLRFLMPNQLFDEKSIKRLIQTIRPEWEEFTAMGLKRSELAIYRNEHFIGYPDQTAYHDYLVAHVRGRPSQAHSLLERLCLDDRVLPIARAQVEFPHIELDPEKVAVAVGRAPERLDTAPSCFGLPHATGASEVCVACPQRPLCASIAEKLCERLRSRHGSDDPFDAAARIKGRDRARRLRATRRASISAAKKS